jgi:hypothetical protein
MFVRAVPIALLLSLSGCASIVSGTMQSLSVTTSGAVDAKGAQCTLVNGKGQWFVTAPGSVTVQRSFSDLVVTCNHETAGSGSFAAKSSTKGMAFGNILLGGFIGAGVDIGTGAAYDYPNVIVVAMGTAPAKSADPAPSVAPAAPAPAASSAEVAAAH